jgi:uncharacterized protein (TIGR02266 family)
LADPNTRQGKRTPVTLKIKFKSETLEQFIERYAVDVSQGGIFIRTKEPLAVGTQMRFEFQLRDASPLIGGEGTVVWTRENDPSRPAIAPGMGVRFDRLAEGSQVVLERILAEKAKQAPQRGTHETAKPPLFTDTPTRVAPAPIRDALLSDSQPAKASDQHTPLPKPVPFHSDAEDYPEEAFEEATKVRDLDELIAQTADPPTAQTTNAPEDDARREPRADATLSDPPASELPETGDRDASATSPGFASGRSSAPALPGPPEVVADGPRLLDTSPSPRTQSGDADLAEPHEPDPMDKLAKTKLGLEPVPAIRSAASSPPADLPARKDAPTRPSGLGAVATEPSEVKLPVKRSSSGAQIVILILVLLAAGAAGVWFFVLRPKAVENNKSQTAQQGSQEGSNPIANPDNGSAEQPPPEPPANLIETEIKATPAEATIEIVGTDQAGTAPFAAKLEKDKAYTARISAPGFATLEKEVTGGQEGFSVALDPKPRVIEVKSDPPGALISLDGRWLGKITPQALELTKAQTEKKKLRVMLRKDGFRGAEKVVEPSDFVEEDARMVAALDLTLAAQAYRPPPPPPPPPPNNGSADPGTGTEQPGNGTPGNGTPGGGAGSGTPGGGTSGSGTPGGAGTLGSGTTPATGTTPAPTGAGASTTTPKPTDEPQPDFAKPQP